MATATLPRSNERTNLADVLKDIIVSINSDGTLVKAWHSNIASWHQMVFDMCHNEPLMKMEGSPQLLKRLPFRRDLGYPYSADLSKTLSGLRDITVNVGITSEYGWFIKKERAEAVLLDLEAMPGNYIEFVVFAAEFARSYISAGNVIDILPVRLRR
jgi:hypothetical protein